MAKSFGVFLKQKYDCDVLNIMWYILVFKVLLKAELI